VVAVGAPDDEPAVPLLAERGLVDGGAAAYPCRGQVCDLPTRDVRTLREFVRWQDWDAGTSAS
jgi:hypothetical protein